MKTEKNYKHQSEYTDEFREQIAKLKLSGRSNEDLMKTYGISRTSINTWAKMYDKSGSFRQKDNESDLEKEVKTLRKENQQLKMEADLLKQCALIMARR
jgi:transposase